MGKARVRRWQLERAKHRKLLVAALAAMQACFVIELVGGLIAGSASLQVDALETTDTKTVADSVMKPTWNERLEKRLNTAAGAFALVLCFWTIGVVIWNYWHKVVPNAFLMAVVSGFVFALNATAFVLLYRARIGNAKMRAAWRGARNDMIGAGTVLIAAGGVWGTGESWPDALALALILPFAAYRAVLTMRVS